MDTIDLSGIEEKDFSAIPAGKYKAIINRIEGKHDNGNKFFFNFEYSLTDEGYKNRRVFSRSYLVGTTPEKTNTLKSMFKGFLKNLGMNKEQINMPMTPDQIIQWCQNKAVEIEVTQRDYEGKTYNDVKNVKGLSAESIPFAAQ